jgi:hypothetical protein
LTNAFFLPRLRIVPAEVRWTSQTVAGARATRIKNTPGLTVCSARYSCAIRCLRSPRPQSITGMSFAAANARTRRANRPANRIRCALSSCASSPYSRRHQTRNPPGLWHNEL